jgi:RNA 3'-terminal phosphate cyclase (ATP)
MKMVSELSSEAETHMHDALLNIDGSQGEGGGQIIRSSLALSMCLQKPFQISHIRANRDRPGLQPQHLTAVTSARAIVDADVEGADIGSQQLVFIPKQILPSDYRFSIGTAGSTTLVLQTLLPALMMADKPSKLVLEGGTHNHFAPPYNFLEKSFLPLIERMGPRVTARLQRTGFAPRGGGIIHVSIQPVEFLKPLVLTERGKILQQSAEVLLAHLPEHIAYRELRVVARSLGFSPAQLHFQQVESAYGPGNVVLIYVQSESVTEVFSAFGERGLPAEEVAEKAVNTVKQYLQSNAAVGKNLADQLLIPMALAGQGAFLTQKPSLHTITNMSVIRQFMNVNFSSRQINTDAWLISID